MKKKKVIAQQMQCYIAWGCNCKKPKSEKRIIVMTTTASNYPVGEPIVTVSQRQELWCKNCNLQIFAKQKTKKKESPIAT